jgi:sulfoxide reductase catalytic subunit YedY
VEKEPSTFWHQAVPNEYDFQANVNPNKPHPRWSQAREQLVETGEVIPTRLYNGYGRYVAHLYK